MLESLRRDAHPLITHHHPSQVFFLDQIQRDIDGLLGSRIPERIDQVVGDDLPNTVGIRYDGD